MIFIFNISPNCLKISKAIETVSIEEKKSTIKKELPSLPNQKKDHTLFDTVNDTSVLKAPKQPPPIPPKNIYNTKYTDNSKASTVADNLKADNQKSYSSKSTLVGDKSKKTNGNEYSKAENKGLLSKENIKRLRKPKANQMTEADARKILGWFRRKHFINSVYLI